MADLIIGENGNLVRQDIISQDKGYGTSSRYVSIQTKDVMDIITEIEPGAEITGWVNSNVRKKEKESFQRHAMMVRMPNSELIPGVHSNLVIFNSSDRSSALKMYSGAFRAVCSNGIVFADTGEALSELSIRHTNKDWKSLVYDLLRDYAKNQEEQRQMIMSMQEKQMSYEDMGKLSERVAEEILNPMITGTVIDPMQLMISKRKEDSGKNLWTVFNRLQEHLLQGGITRIIEKVEEDDTQARLIEIESNTHKISDPQKQIKVNRQLHSMIMELV